MTMIDTPRGMAFVRAAAREAALSLEIRTGLKRKGRTAYSIVKEVYGFRGSRESVFADLEEYVASELRLKELDTEIYKNVHAKCGDVIDLLTAQGLLDQPHFERYIEAAEANGAISHAFRQAMSDLFYVSIVRSNAHAAGESGND
jgi:hypothetical protein